MDLFDQTARKYYDRYAPLADRMRPRSLEEFEGQPDALAPGSPVDLLLKGQNRSSLIFWGPPGCGKTTLVRLLAQRLEADFIALSAVHAGKSELVRAEKQAREHIRFQGRSTVLFVDEIHRFNKLQQDGLLRAVEEGTFTFMGATTENPGFEVISPLLSRCRVVVLEPLSGNALEKIVLRALRDPERGLGKTRIGMTNEALSEIVRLARGDGRTALNLLELSALAAAERAKKKSTSNQPRRIVPEDISRGMDRRTILYDKTGDEHYNLISAFIKSVRASDPQAAVYYLARMIEGGEDPVFIARRLVILASEDIGNGDPFGAVMAASIFSSVHRIGMPESRILLAQLTTYLSLAPKSNAAYLAVEKALGEVRESGALPVPKKILNAPTGLMKDLGYHEGYHYAHDYRDGFYPERMLPEALSGRVFYEPGDIGREKELKKRLEELEQRIRESE
jgi:putative ATPase